MTITEFIRDNVPFLQGLTEEQARALAQAVDQKHFKHGQTVIFKGTTVDGLHVIASGKVAVFLRPDKNKDWVRVAELGPGDVFGERSILEFCTAGATIKGESEETLIFVLPQTAFRDLLELSRAVPDARSTGNR
ncbi:MAG: cyclic nucleotide-binding domain-containing protein [candidate division NC10 bacterium]